jgi:uncharacterized membrane protein
MGNATAATSRARPSTWRLPAVLIALGLPPLVAGVVRVVQVAGGPQGLEVDERFNAFPAPLYLHVVAVLVYALLGAAQFSPGLRRRFPEWHRRVGRIALPAAFGVSGSALWMTFAYRFKPGTGRILFATRLVVAVAMTYALVEAFRSIRRRAIRSHRAWMIRAYALGLGAATQMLTLGFGEPIFGDGTRAHDLLMATGWAVNALIAEWIIRRGDRGRAAVAEPAAA